MIAKVQFHSNFYNFNSHMGLDLCFLFDMLRLLMRYLGNSVKLQPLCG